MSPKSRILALTVAVSILLILCATYFVYGHDEDVIFEIEESDDGILRYVTVTGDYKFDEYAKNGSHELDLSDFYAFLAENVTDGKTINGVNPANCSTFTISKTDSDGYLAGRNFDFRHVEPGVVYTDPDNGYASVSVVDLRMFSDTGSSLEDMRSDSRLNAVPYIPLDGMNEKGVFVAINSVHDGPSMTMDRPENVPIFTTSALRLILDNAASTQEAVDLV